MVKEKDTVSHYGTMVINMKDTGKMVRPMVKVSSSSIVELYTMETG